MPITTIILFIILALLVIVLGSFFFTKKEHAAALKRQEIANLRFKADEAQEMFDGLQHAGLEKITYQFLLERIIVNLSAAYDVSPLNSGVKSRLDRARHTLESLDSQTFVVQIPSAMHELHGMLGKLNKLVKYLFILYQKKIIPEQQYQNIMPAVQRTLLKFDAEGHIKLGHQAANEGQFGTAKQNYLYAKEKLLSFGSDDSYVKTQLEKVDQLMQLLDQKPTSQEQLEPVQEIHPSDENAQTKSADVLVEKTIDVEDDNIVLSQEELNKMNETKDGFAPKKKW